MNRSERTILSFIALCGVCLLAAALLKPRVNPDFHHKYTENLNHLNTMIGELGRDHLQVQFGIVLHYDYLEADLQEMEKAIGLTLLTPDFVDAEYQNQVHVLHDTFLGQLARVRELVEKTKRYIGLVRNSKRSISYIFSLVRDETESQRALKVLARLYQGVVDRSGETLMLDLVERMGERGEVPGDILGQMRAHVGIVSRYSVRLHEISNSLNEALSQIDAPATLREAYLEQYSQQVDATQTVAWFANVIGALLVALCLLLVRFTQKAKQRTLEASGQIEQQMDETHRAVEACNEVLEQISQGDFRSRVEHQFGGDLGLLCEGVNNTAARVDEAMQQLALVMGAIEQGRFDQRMDPKMEGELRHQVERAMTALEETLNNIVEVMEQMRNGNFTSRIRVEAKGDLGRLKSAVNESLDAMEAAIDEITGVMQGQSQGDLSQRIEQDLPGQLGSLSESINISSDSLESIVKDLRVTSDELASVGGQVHQQSQSLSETSSEQVSALSETLTSTEDVTRSVSASRELTQVATEQAVTAKNQALNGEKVAEQAIVSMERVLLSSKQISEITDMINEIAFQTHLLSLNAAIEAARASQQGAGFGVVAQEVGSLARRCAESSSEIRKLVGVNFTQIEQGAKHVRETGVALSSISSAVEQVSQVVLEINEHCIEQSASIEHVNHAISRVDDLTQHNATLAERSLSSAMQLSTHSKSMLEIVNIFNR